MELKTSFIYKYCSLSTAIEIIRSQSLKFTNPKAFNDPFDCDIDLLEFNFMEANHEIKEDLKKVKLALETKNGKEKSDFVDNIPNSKIETIYRNSQLKKIEKSSVCCFSYDFSNKVMWSHYADSHKGSCLIFDLACEKPFLNYDAERFTQSLVDYENYRPINYMSSKKNGIIRLFLTKSHDWFYEQEFRIMIFEKSGLLKFNRSFFKGIIFGLRVPDPDINNIKLLLKEQGFTNLIFAKYIKEKLDMKLEFI